MSTKPDDANLALIAAFQARFPGATVVARTELGDADDRSGLSGFHQINAPIFSVLAPDIVRRGWSVFPQTRDGRRGPGIVDRQTLRWGKYQTRRPTQTEIEWWSAFCPGHNVALILGPASGDTFAIDVDVSDLELSVAIQDLAIHHLGLTPFRRVGRSPRIILIYRQAPARETPADQRIASRQLPFIRLPGEEGSHVLEILGPGKPVTGFGIHHGTGQYFKWLGVQPQIRGPEYAPLVSQAGLDAFLDGVNGIRPFSNTAASRAEDTSWTYDAKANLHRVTSLGNVEWEVEDERVVGGRERFLFSLVSQTVRANEAAARDPQAGRRQICALVETEFLAKAELSGKWTSLHLKHEIAAKVNSSSRHFIANGGFRNVRPGTAVAVDGDGEVQHAPSVTEDVDAIEAPELAHLPHRVQRQTSRLGKNAKRGYQLRRGPDVLRAVERALLINDDLRKEAAQAATAAIRAHLDGWIAGLYARAGERRALETAARHRARQRTQARAENAGVQFDESAEVRVGRADLTVAPVSILKGDAGSGKTSSFWRALARAIESRGRLGFPVGFAMPSHANIENSLDGAVKAKLAWEHSVDEAVTAGEKAGLKVLVFRGRLRTNCKFKQQIKALNAASIQAERLCRSRVNANAGMPGAEPDWQEVRCPMFETCEYQRTLAEVAHADVVLFASAYLSAKVPAALTDALLALVVDERPYSDLLKTNSAKPMPLSILELGRPAPRLLDEELAPLMLLANPRERIEEAREGYLADRVAAVRLVLPHLRTMNAGAAVLALHNHRVGNRRAGLELARAAYAVCSRGSNLSKDVVPGMDEAAAEALAATPQGGGMWDERRFWSLVVNRLEALETDEENPVAPMTAKGAHDARLQVVADGECGLCVRMSWRAAPSFAGIPLMMLDASAAPAIVQKCWPERTIETLEVTAPCHMRVVLVTGSTYSDFSMLPGRSRKMRAIRDAAARVHLHREVVTRLAGVHGNGKVLVGGNKSVMAVLRAGWKPPANIDFAHNGAMRGLDMFKNHAAAVLFGRLELPPRAIDAYVAALTYDDDEPEQPVDRFGTGEDEKGKPLVATIGEKLVAMRDGRDIVLRDQTYEGAWARLVQCQWREEEVRQFAARLRPVHRLGRPPVAYLACTAIPEGMIVDDVVHMQDLLHSSTYSNARPFEIARETDGVLDNSIGWDSRDDLVPPDAPPGGMLAWSKVDVPGHPEAQGLTRIRWRLHGGPWSTGSILTWSDDPVTALARAVAREQGLAIEEVLGGLEIDRLWQGLPRAVSGTRAPDKIDRANLNLSEDAELSHEQARALYADEEARDRHAMMQRVRLELSGLDEGATYAEVEAALAALRITQIDWNRLAPWEGADRKLEGVPLAVRILMARYGAADADMSDIDG